MITDPYVGEAVVYTAIAGEQWDARVAKVYRERTPIEVDLEILADGDRKPPMYLRNVLWTNEPIKRKAEPK